MAITEERAARIEDKIDELTKAIQKLILIDERQMEHGKRVGALEERCADLEKQVMAAESVLNTKVAAVKATVDKAIWMGTGMAIVLTILWGLGQAVLQFSMRT